MTSKPSNYPADVTDFITAAGREKSNFNVKQALVTRTEPRNMTFYNKNIKQISTMSSEAFERDASLALMSFKLAYLGPFHIRK